MTNNDIKNNLILFIEFNTTCNQYLDTGTVCGSIITKGNNLLAY